MKKKMSRWLIPSILGALSVVFIIAGVTLTQKPDIFPVRTDPGPDITISREECKTISYHGDDKVNLVFFGPQEDVEEYANFMFATAPYDEQVNNFNVYYIEDFNPECELYKSAAILCYSDDLVHKAATCPNDFIVVIDDTQASTVRSSAYLNVVSVNKKHPKTVLTHELGHVIANLAEEYVPARLPDNSKNCVSTCSQFGQNTDGCFEGCSESDYHRSIERGVMRTLS